MKKLMLVVLFVSLFLVAGLAKDRVTVWFAGTTESLMNEVESTMIPEFESENPDIELVVEFIPWGELSTKLTTSFAGGIGPDIFMHGQAAIAGFVENGLIMPIDGFLSSIEDVSDFGSAIDVGIYKGENYFIPVFGSGRLLAYRADFFEEAGLDPEQAPDTWEQLRYFASKTTERVNNQIKVAGLDIPVEGQNLQQVWTSFLIENNGSLFDDEFNPTFNSPEGVEALEFYVDLILKDKVASEYGLTSVGNLAPIAAGTTAITFIDVETMSAAKKYAPDIYDEIKLAFPPERYRRAGFYSFAGFMVSKSTKNLDSTIKALSYLTSKDSIVEINEAIGSLPPRQSASEAEFIASDPVLKKFVEGAKYAFGNPNVPFWVQARDILAKYLERAVKGVMEPKEALDEAAKEIIKLK